MTSGDPRRSPAPSMAPSRPLLIPSPRAPPPDPPPLPSPTPTRREIPIGTPLLSTNAVTTAKYTPLSFLPRNLFEQFHRAAYLYFLVIAVLNQLPMLAVFGRGASVLPLAFVLLVTLVKDGYEDWRRHRSDRAENNKDAEVLVGQGFETIRWRDLRVGHMVRVKKEETLPCDLVLLATSDSTGVAYVQTINLDGESNLKTRYARQETMLKKPEISGINGVILCERPNRNIYGFTATMEVDGCRMPLGPSNIVLRGCQLKNTSWIVGAAVYTGNETKVMLNSSEVHSKRSRLETLMNRETISLSVILFAMCLIVSILHGIWLGNHRKELDNAPFYRKRGYSPEHRENYNYYGIPLETFFTFLKSVIVFQIMIPISLYISMELVRLGQAYFMIRDCKLYDETSNSRFQCRALNINEDLGQIKYVFSDKTGTLTENKMEFQCASIGGVSYGYHIGSETYVGDYRDCYVSVDGQVRRSKIMVKTDPELMQLLHKRKNMDGWKRAHDFFLALAACNTIVPLNVETPDTNTTLIDYQGESPDEQALVYAAASHDFVLIERTSGHIDIDILGNRQRFSIFGLHEFDSDRKRMSVIVGCPDGTKKLFVKGADSSMIGILDSLDPNVVGATESHLHTYSSLGLRTLVVGMRELSNTEFEQWQLAFQQASTTLHGRTSALRAVAVNIEHNLHLLGASAIEDKLQQGVPDAIESLKQAGVKVWVLTGDKQETAISIGFSCKLLTREMTQITINSHSKESSDRSLEDAVAISKKVIEMTSGLSNSGGNRKEDRTPLALVIDGNSLVYILETELEEKLFEVATACDVVLCCRVAPLQKAGIVALIKNRTDAMTLAIGDGANDVSMIQMADVGIGISGQEGRQAVMASDFAMGQFRFLVPLLLVHGHWNYQRMAYMILYNFYRNSVFVFMLFWYVLFTAYTLTTAVTEWSSVLYSIIYTALPTIIVGILDKNLKKKTLISHPQLYGTGQREESYNLKLFLLTMVDSLWQSLAVFFIPYLAYNNSTIDASSIGDLFTLAVVFLVNIHLGMDVIRWNWITHVGVWGCIVATGVCVVLIDCVPWLPGYWAMIHLMGTWLFWLCLFGTIIAGMVPRFVLKALSEYFWPTDVQIAREMEKYRHRYSTPTEVEMSTHQNTR